MNKLVLLIAVWMFLGINVAWAEKGTHMHMAVFFVDKSAYNETLPAEIKGDDIEGPLRGKAELMTFTHSANINHNDVLNIQNDTLRFDENHNMQDRGINCSLTMKTEPIWTVSGLCKVFLSGKDKTETHIIKAIPLKSSLVWYKVFEDNINHVIGYAMKEEGENL